jgi:anti-sigma B factor antagonist
MTQAYGITVRRIGAVAALGLAGEFDLACVGDLEKAIAEALTEPAPAAIVIDLDAAVFIDSSIIRVLVTSQQTAAEQQVTMMVANARGMVERVLKVTGVYELLTGVA